MNIYKHEFRMSIASVVTWSVSLVLLVLAYMSVFGVVAEDAKLLNDMMDKFPKELLMAFGMMNMDMSTILGFYGLVFTFVQVCLAIQAANYGFSLVSIEETEMTADFLLTRPVTRSQILTNKLLAVFTGLTITNIAVWISSIGFISVFGRGETYDTATLLLLLVSIVIFQLTFLSLGLLISLLVKRLRSVMPYSMGLAFGMYVLSAFGGMLGDVKLELITPFKHFEPNYIITNAAYNLPLVAISLVYIVASVAGSYVLYTKRNIQTAG